MASDTTLRSALRRFGLDVHTHVGASWTYALVGGQVVHLCWKQGPSISWSTGANGTLVYRDTFGGFDPSTASRNAQESFSLLGAAEVEKQHVRCIMVSGSKAGGTKYTPREDLIGTVTMAVPESGKGIEIVFRRRTEVS